MKPLVAIVRRDDAGGMVDALLKSGYRTTRLQSSGGFLKKSSTTLLVGVGVGVGEDAPDDVIAIIRAHSQSRTQVIDPDKAAKAARWSGGSPRKVSIGAAVVVVVPIEQFERV